MLLQGKDLRIIIFKLGIVTLDMLKHFQVFLPGDGRHVVEVYTTNDKGQKKSVETDKN